MIWFVRENFADRAYRSVDLSPRGRRKSRNHLRQWPHSREDRRGGFNIFAPDGRGAFGATLDAEVSSQKYGRIGGPEIVHALLEAITPRRDRLASPPLRSLLSTNNFRARELVGAFEEMHQVAGSMERPLRVQPALTPWGRPFLAARQPISLSVAIGPGKVAFGLGSLARAGGRGP